MIQIDISNIWGQIDLPDLLAMEQVAFDAHEKLSNGTGQGGGFRGWLKLASKTTAEELERIQAAAEQIRSDSNVCVVLGVGGACSGAWAAMELLQGRNRNLGKGKGDPEIFFLGNSLNTYHWYQLVDLLEDKDFSLVVISGASEPLAQEAAINFRGLKWILERRYGTEEANNRIYAVIDSEQGPLGQMASENSWFSLSIPSNITEPFSVLTAAGLLPMAVAGIDIAGIIAGAAEAEKEYDLRSFENPVWLYAAVRSLMQQNVPVELLGSFEPDFAGFGDWWVQLFGSAEGAAEKGLFPGYVDLTQKPSTVHLVLKRKRVLFETMIRFDAPERKYEIGFDVKDLDESNYLAGKNLDQVEEQIFLGTVEAHADAGVPVMVLDCGARNEETLGHMFYFFQLSCAISAYMQETDPFDRSGVTAYRENMLWFLGKPMEKNEK